MSDQVDPDIVYAMRMAFASGNRLWPAPYTPDWTALLKQHSAHKGFPPWDDHGELWLQDGRPVCYTAHPYNMEPSTRTALAALCSEHGLTYEIHPPAKSWYNPGNTYLVILWAEGRAT